MKKIFLFSAILSLSLNSCNDNDDKEIVIDVPQDSIVGEWQLTSRQTGTAPEEMITVILGPCESELTLMFYSDNNLREQNFGGDACTIMAENFTDWQHVAGNVYNWGEAGNAGNVTVTFSENKNVMTTLSIDGANYVAETYFRQ